MKGGLGVGKLEVVGRRGEQEKKNFKLMFH